jgi:DNA-binding transcriptional ArsR family regulator
MNREPAGDLTGSAFDSILAAMVKYGGAHLDRIFAALGNPTRRAILDRLSREPGLSISELAEPLSLKLPSIMKHLDVLAEAGLVSRNKCGRTVSVELRPKPMTEAMRWLQRHEKFWSSGLTRLTAYAERKEAEARRNKR